MTKSAILMSPIESTFPRKAKSIYKSGMKPVVAYAYVNPWSMNIDQ